MARYSLSRPTVVEPTLREAEIAGWRTSWWTTVCAAWGKGAEVSRVLCLCLGRGEAHHGVREQGRVGREREVEREVGARTRSRWVPTRLLGRWVVGVETSVAESVSELDLEQVRARERARARATSGVLRPALPLGHHQPRTLSPGCAGLACSHSHSLLFRPLVHSQRARPSTRLVRPLSSSSSSPSRPRRSTRGSAQPPRLES